MTCQVTSQCFQWLNWVGTWAMTSTRTGRSSDVVAMAASCPQVDPVEAGGSIPQDPGEGVEGGGVPDEDWRGLDDAALGRLLVERWLYRGLMLAIIFLAAIILTWQASRGFGGLADQVTAGVLVALAVAAAVVAFVMRQHDLEIHRELRRRRSR
jgi:hypothetical protein